MIFQLSTTKSLKLDFATRRLLSKILLDFAYSDPDSLAFQVPHSFLDFTFFFKQAAKVKIIFNS